MRSRKIVRGKNKEGLFWNNKQIKNQRAVRSLPDKRIIKKKEDIMKYERPIVEENVAVYCAHNHGA